jgi:hypothetical protein
MQPRIRAIATIAAATLVPGLTASALALAHDGKHHGQGIRHAGTATCTLKLIAALPPRTLTAENFGTADCGRPFGTGVQHDSSTVTPTSQRTGTFTGPVKQFFDRGTVSGTFTIAYSVAADGGVTYDGTITLTHGTGRYRHINGTGTLKGFSPDAVHSTITETLTFTRH